MVAAALFSIALSTSMMMWILHLTPQMQVCRRGGGGLRLFHALSLSRRRGRTRHPNRMVVDTILDPSREVNKGLMKKDARAVVSVVLSVYFL